MIQRPLPSLYRKGYLISFALTVVCLLPFFNKAFHIDDPLFLWAAQQIVQNPIDFFGGTVNWYGWSSSLAKAWWNPPGHAYYLSLFGMISGWHERTLHLAMLAPNILAIWGLYYVAQRWCRRRLLVVCLMLGSPLFLVSATNVMCDTAMLALWLWSLGCWMEGEDRQETWRCLLSVFLMALGVLTKYFAIALIPLAVYYSIASSRKMRHVFYLLIPLSVLFFYEIYTRRLYGAGLFWDALLYARQMQSGEERDIITKLLTGLAFVGGGIPSLIFFSPFLFPRRQWMAGIGVAILILGGLVLQGHFGSFDLRKDIDASALFLLQAGCMLMGGITLFVLAIQDVMKNRDAGSWTLLLWVLGTFVFAAYLNWSVTARSLLAIVPPAGCLIVRALESRGLLQTSLWSKSVWIPLLLSFLLSLGIAHADYGLANISRKAVGDLDPITDRFGKQKIWFQGHWGFQYYMQENGAKPLDFTRSDVGPGDIVVVPSNNTNTQLMRQEVVRLDDFLEYRPLPWLTTMGRNVGAGYYSNDVGPLPFAFGKVEPAQFWLFQARWDAEPKVVGDKMETELHPKELSQLYFAEGHKAMEDFKKDVEGALQRAVEFYQAAVEYDSENAPAHNSLAIALTFQGNLEGAAQHYEQALQLKPDFITARKNLELIQNMLNKSEEEKKAFVDSLDYQVSQKE